jgi:hypothetical protein
MHAKLNMRAMVGGGSGMVQNSTEKFIRQTASNIGASGGQQA